MAVFICQSCGNEHSSWEGKCPNCGHTEIIKLNQLTDRMIEKTIKGKYKIVRKLGQGGMGAVYLAEQLGIGHRVALKFLKNEFSSDVEIARRFMNEAKSYARVAHPNAVVFHDFGQDDDGNLFIAMEYCEGTDLKKVIADARRMPVADVVEVVLQVADVLANAHSKGVIHRDLKPENIMLRKGMRGVHAKVLDFGIARLMGEGTRLTVQGAIAGTPRYMSPEQVEGKEVDHRADVYALGILTFECLTGVQPFDGNTITEILRKQVLEPMPHLKDISTDLDFPEIDKVIQRAVAKKKEDRWPDMLAFASALSQATPTLAGKAFAGLAPLEGDGTQQTIMRGETPMPAVGLASPVPGAGTQLATPVPGGASLLSRTLEGAPSPGDSSIIKPPTKSSGPMLAVGAVVVIALAIGGWALLPRKSDVVVPPPPPRPVVEVQPTPEPPPVKQPGADDIARAINANLALTQMAQARTEFENGNLDAADNYLRSVLAVVSDHADATAMRETIATIKKKTDQAQAFQRAGQCDRASPIYRDVLKLNARAPGVAGSLKACGDAELPGVIQ